MIINILLPLDITFHGSGEGPVSLDISHKYTLLLAENKDMSTPGFTSMLLEMFLNS